MSANEYIHVGVLVNSCLIGANAYRVLSDEAEFQESWLEEITDSIRQQERPGHRFMYACTELDKTELWMIPFAAGAERLLTLQDAMEHVQANFLGAKHFVFPFDVVEEDSSTALVMRPMNRFNTAPIRKFLPNSQAPRWQIAKSLFHRVRQLHQMGLTSNGISREQLRVDEDSWEVELRLNHTLRLIHSKGQDMRHQGFSSLPVFTEEHCLQCQKPITGVQRDIFSAAVLTFYLIMYNHPFLGAHFKPLSRDEYLTKYLHAPSYTMDPNGSNGLGNQRFDREVEYQWGLTVPELKQLFDGIFLAACDPENKWDPKDPWWNIDNWLAAIDADRRANDNEKSRTAYEFSNYYYHMV